MLQLRAIARGIALVFLTIWYLTPILIRSAVRGDDLRHALRVRQRWAKAVTGVLGLQLREEGLPVYQGPCIYICNHRSYMDPIIALRQIRALPVAKAEVSNWPLVGFAARATGILYVRRDSRRSRSNTLAAMETSLKKGDSILIYPEGTTHLNAQTTTFKKGAFRLAADLKLPIVPIAMGYGRPEDAWIGDDTFLPHFIRTFGRPRTEVWIRYGDPIQTTDQSDLLERTQAWIDEQLKA